MGRDRSAKGEYSAALAALTGPGREAYLLGESRLPGPRANLELLAAAVEECSREEPRRWADPGAWSGGWGARTRTSGG